MAVLAEYFCSDRDGYLFVARAGEALRVTPFPLGPLHDELAAFLGGVLGGRGAAAGDALRALVQPIVENAAEDEVVCIVPHGMLHYLPFHALPTGEGILGLRNPVCYAPSASALPVCRAATRLCGHPVVVAGDPTGDLRYALREAEGVAEAFGGELLSGTRATKQALYRTLERHAAVDILHLACHGSAGVRQGMQSGVVLAAEAGGDASEGELLTADEILRRRLHVGLVTVSACDAGLGEVAASDEVLGLTRALLYAGAASALLSYWPLDDFSTSLVVEQFYAGLRRMIENRAGDKATAVRDAQRLVHDMTLRDVVGRCDRAAERCAARSDLAGQLELMRAAAEWAGAAGDVHDALLRYRSLAALAQELPEPFAELRDRVRDQIEELEFRTLLQPPPLDYDRRPFSGERHWAGLFLHGDWKL